MNTRVGMTSDERLAEHAIERGAQVEVDLVGLPGRLVEGRVAGSTPAILLIGGRQFDTSVRWDAIATIRRATAPHPAI